MSTMITTPLPVDTNPNIHLHTTTPHQLTRIIAQPTIQPLSTSLPLIHQRAGLSQTSYSSADLPIHTGEWIPFTNDLGVKDHLPGPNGGGGIGLPNYVPYGHPNLSDANGATRLKHGHQAVERMQGSQHQSQRIGLEGKPFESNQEKNKRQAKAVEEASQMIAQLASVKESPRQNGSSNITQSMDSIFSRMRAASIANAPSQTSSAAHANSTTANPASTSSSKFATVRGGMPHFEVEKFMRSNHSMLSSADRLSASEVLKVEPYDRDPTHLATLSKFLASIDFFAGLSDNLRFDIAAIATLRTLRKDEPVYVEGDDALHLYVILSGTVGTKVRNFLVGKGLPGSSSSSSSFVAATIGPGECFGQESMGTEERTLTRTQTKVALERTELLQVDMRDYKSILRISMSKEAADKLDFVALLPLFEKCTMRELHRIASSLQIVKYPKNHIILKQGEPSDKVFFIESGEVRVIHKIYSSEKVLVPPASRSISPPRSVTLASSHGGSGSGTSPVAPTRCIRGGGGAYKFERARAFEASRRHTSPSTVMRPIWGQATNSNATSAHHTNTRPSTHHSETNDSLSPAPSHSLPTAPSTRHTLVPRLLDLGRLGPKWFFGEVGVLRNSPRSASVYAETPVTLMVMSKEDFFTRLPPFCIKYIDDYMNTFYSPDSVLKSQWAAQQRWDSFKAELVQPGRMKTHSVMETNRKFTSTLNAMKY